ncbi:MAG: hypothetical protein ABR985_18345 [Methanotrichaceae archaeon]
MWIRSDYYRFIFILDAFEPTPRERKHPDRLRGTRARSPRQEVSAYPLNSFCIRSLSCMKVSLMLHFIAHESLSQANSAPEL